MADEGYEGKYVPKRLPNNVYEDLCDVVGPPPIDGKKWVMVNMDTGEWKWYRARKKGYSGGRSSYRPRGRY